MKHLFIAFSFFFYLTASAQQDCSEYKAFMEKGGALKLQKDYNGALQQFMSAQVAARQCGETTDKASTEIKAIFAETQKALMNAEIEKIKADSARNEAYRAREATQLALALADSSRRSAIRARDTTQRALAKANKLINAFYFYDNRFALAYGSRRERFYFIDKDGNEMQKLGYWLKAQQFEDGYARVINRYFDVYGSDTLTTYLLDTAGNTYPMAFDYRKIDTTITALDLRNTNLESVPYIFTQTRLNVLLLNRNRLKKLPGKLSDLFKLVLVDVSDNELEELSSQVTELKKLSRLYLNNNRLTALPSGMDKLSELTELKAINNKIKKLPSQIGELKNLKVLDLRKNKLEKLPSEIGNLKSLEILDISSNAFSVLPEELSNLENLTSLAIGYNGLTKLPESLSQLKHLKFLSLAGNNFPPQEIAALKKLMPQCYIY